MAHRTPAVVPTSLAEFRARAGTTSDALFDGPAAAVDVRALRATFTAAVTSDPRGSHFHRTVAAVLTRADRVPATDAREWNRFLELLVRHRHGPKAPLHCGVLANLVGIATFGDDADLVALSELSSRLGGERLAAVQHRAARFIEPDPTFPITTAALRRIITASPHPTAGPILDSAIALLLEGVDPDHNLPGIRTESELVGVVEGGSVLEWRRHLALIGASPWSPYSRHLVDLARQAARPQVAELVDRCTTVYRERNKERERLQVAEEVGQLVAASGANQRQFAHWVGTSPSRLSTYISGTVTPSASLVLRMTRVSRLLRERDVPPMLSPRSEPTWGGVEADVDGGADRSAGPTEHAPGALGRGRSHLSVI